ncbi:MAG: radical SAM protein [Planctomycetota bacterium]
MEPAPGRYTYGPVPSRRLGRSLGVDLVPFKVCCYDCIYCQLGRTTNKTVERREYNPIDEVIAELEGRCAEGLKADYITLSGSGEPTLNSEIARVIEAAKKMTTTPIAVLTNGALLGHSRVRRDLLKADLVVPSLDAGTADVFERVNRPCPSIDFEKMVTGIVQFRNEFRGQMWLEVFLVNNINTDDGQLGMLKGCIDRIRPDRIHLNTVARPPAEQFAERVPDERLREIAAFFGDSAEIISPFERAEELSSVASGKSEVLALVSRRPCSLRDIASGLGMHENEAVKYVTRLLAEGAVIEKMLNGEAYYIAASGIMEELR